VRGRPEAVRGVTIRARVGAAAFLGAALLAAMAAADPAAAATIEVAAGESLAAAIERAAPGDTLRLSPGRYPGNVVVDKTLVIEGPEDRSAIVEGDGQGRTIWVRAPDVVIRRVTVRGSG